MYYSELINFESLETVIEIRDADHAPKAKQLVQTYVISNDMADRLINLVFTQLQFHQPSDNKGLLIVGNYGTGKSHLMAVISSLAENAELVEAVTHPQVAEAAQTFAGRFYVLRTEIGATTRSLRDIMIAELETYLETLGVPFKFPPADTITNNKTALVAMMVALETSYPDLGLLLVVDELLEYLRTRKDQELILDLNFLRELGEVCKNTRFRFIAGIQETIFDNQRFAFVAGSLRRVKDRFEQVLITRKDIKFVVAERLLKKTDQQLAKVRNYLSPFAAFYSNLSERLEEFCALFPVHPDYIDTFERITLIEKREILKTLERECKARLAQPVPNNYPNLIAYDSYWNILRENPSFRTLPEIREVIECSQVLENRIQQAFTLPVYKAMALRIVHGLSVHRLTTHDIYVAVGVTAQELRDSLCLYQPGVADLGGNPAEDLLSLVETVLREILKTVNRQFISTNPDNRQYYLDLKKSYDFDAIIEKRIESLENYQLDRSYYIALKQLLELTDQPTGVSGTGCLTWEYELEWRSHRVTRLGLLVFGAPNERPTAIPPRDFYLYFLQPHEPPKFKDGKRANELFFLLTGSTEKFEQLLRNYTATSELLTASSGHAKAVYESKSQTYLRDLIQWLQDHLTTAVQVTHEGRSKELLAWTKGQSVQERAGRYTEERQNGRDLIEWVANICLEQHFSDIAPAYPIFPILIVRDHLATIAQDTVRNLASPNRSKLVNGLLAGLELLDEDRQLNPAHSKYAQTILDLLHQQPQGQVLNRADLLHEEIDMTYFAPDTYRLEPELLIVLLAALVCAREIVLTIGGQQFDAANFDALASIPLNDLLYFRYIERPKGFNLPALKALFELLELPAGLDVALVQNDDQAVRQLHTKVREQVTQLVQAQQVLVTGLTCWGKPLLSDTDMQHYRENLSQTKNFLESLQVFSSPTKFKNFRYGVEEVHGQRAGLETLQDLLTLQTLLNDLNPPVAYLTAAEATLPPDQAWLTEMNQVRNELLPQLNVHQCHTSGLSYQLKQPLLALQKSYVKAYLKLHTQARLGVTEDQERTRLLNDNRLLTLRKLSKIAILPHSQLDDFDYRLNQLKSCFELTEYDLTAQTICPHCGFKPIAEAQHPPALTTLVQLNKTLRILHTDWTQTLLTELEQVAPQRELLKPDSRVLLETFLTRRTLPENLSPEFIEAVQESLSGLFKIILNIKELHHALSAGGSPITVKEMQKRFTDYLNQLTTGKELNKIRIVLE
jgi:hypothetical protein